MKKLAMLAFAALLVAAALPGRFTPAHANGVPQLVKLTYLDGVSNFGPKDAEGVLEFSFAEAYAKVDVKNLVPEAGYVFDGWLSGPGGDVLRVGQISLDASGIGQFQGELAGLQSYDYNMFIIAARPAGSAVPTSIPDTRSIAGRFAVLADNGQAQTGADTRPQQLPDTGEKPKSALEENGSRIAYAGAVMAVAAVATFTIRRIQRRRSS